MRPGLLKGVALLYTRETRRPEGDQQCEAPERNKSGIWYCRAMGAHEDSRSFVVNLGTQRSCYARIILWRRPPRGLWPWTWGLFRELSRIESRTFLQMECVTTN
jgi:hypothetical protein